MGGQMETIYVALDLGSESMAAYYADTFGNGGMINLQAQAPSLLGISEAEADSEAGGIDFLPEAPADGNFQKKRSPRMWNRISLNDGRLPQELTDEHATMLFSTPNDYDRSLFRHFHQKGGWPPGNGKIMPNPK